MSSPAAHKRVLMVLDREFPPDLRVENQIGLLQRIGIEMHILVYTRQARPTHELMSNGLHIHRRPISTLVFKSSVAMLTVPLYRYFWLKAMRWLIKDYSFDAIHIHDLPLATVGKSIAEELDIPFVLDLHENWPYHLDTAAHANTVLGKILSRPAQWRAYEADMVGSADMVVTVVQEMSDRIAALGAEPDKLVVYQNVPELSLEAVSVQKTQRPHPTLIYAGGVNYHRGIQYVLNALAIVKERGVHIHFSVLGSGAYLTDLKALAHALGIEEMVDFLGHVDQERVMSEVKQSDIAIVPHLRSVQNDHSSPNKIYQYMLSSTAVFTSDCRSLARVVKETDCGLVYTYDDTEDLADKLIQAVSAPEQLETWGRNGRAAVENRYNTEVEGRSLVRAYTRLLC